MLTSKMLAGAVSVTYTLTVIKVEPPAGKVMGLVTPTSWPQPRVLVSCKLNASSTGPTLVRIWV